MGPRTRATRSNRKEKGAKRGRTARRGALASTPQPLPGQLRLTPSKNHPGARGPENVTAARPLAARPELAAERRTGTGIGTVRETLLGGNVVAKEGGGDPGVALSPSLGLVLGLDQDPELDPTDEGPAPNGRPPESSLPRGRSVEVAGGLSRAVGLVLRDGGREALGALKTVCLRKVPLNARAGRKIQTGSRKRVVATPVARAGSHGAAEGQNAAGAQGGAATTAGSPETTSQVQAAIQGMTRTAASMKTAAVAGGKSPTQETIWTGQAGHRHPAGPSGGRCPQTFRIITPRGREEDQEAGTDKRRSIRQQQMPPKASLLPRQYPVTLRCR